MANINVNRDSTDQFYRYKMPRLIAKVEGKGNGIKTVIVNMPEVAKALSRPPTYTTKYFGCELGAQTQFDLKNDRYIVNGSHDTSKLQDLLDGFIKKFVLCPECSNPETNLSVRAKAAIIVQRCIACGYSNNLEMRHKLTTYILKNPPDQDPTTSTPNKRERRGNRKNKDGDNKPITNGDTSPTANCNSGENYDAPPQISDNHDTNWGEDVTQEAIQNRMEELSGAAKMMALNEDVEKSQNERLEIFYNYVKGRKDSAHTQVKEIFVEAERLDVADKAPLVLCEALLDENILSQLKTFRLLFLRFTHENQKCQKYLLGGIEQLVGNVHKDTLLAKVAHILKVCYDLDLLDEEVILKWGERVSKRYVPKEISTEIHAKAAPFITWLKEAEEESDEEEENDDEEVEIVYTHLEKVGTHSVSTVIEDSSNKQEEGDDDIDIDDI